MLFSSLKRVTSSGKYIPEIDALRFIAIAMVVFSHISELIFRQPQSFFIQNKSNYSGLHSWMCHGFFGVDIFFAISGFILALPFAESLRNGSTFPSLRSYFRRRLTRLEPPYVISLFIFFIALLLLKIHSFQELWKSFLASLFYSHNFLHDRSYLPLINNVTWSLEVEIQFYILAPFLMILLYKIKQAQYRKILLMVLILSLSALTKFTKPQYISLYEYFHFFLIGILICEYFLDKNFLASPERNDFLRSTFLLPVLACMMIGMKHTDITYMGSMHPSLKVLLSTLQLLLLILFFYLILIKGWGGLFTRSSLICIIGGMCYSIYLLHNPIIQGLGHLMFNVYHDNSFPKTFIQYTAILVSAVMLVSTLFFIFVEKPFMSKRSKSSTK